MTMYDLLNYAGFLALLVFHFINVKEHQRLPGSVLRLWAAKRRSDGHGGWLSNDLFWVIVGIILVSAFQYAPAIFLNKPFGKLVGTGANYFGALYTVPVFLSVYCRIMRIDPARQIDVVVPAFPLALFFAKLGCFTAGCCGGVAWKHGLLNPYTKIVEFPIQLLEAGVALLLFFLLLKMRTRLKPGTAFPVYLMLYSGIRFFTEFLRSAENVWGILKIYHFLCLIGVVLGILEYVLAVTVGRRIGSARSREDPESSEIETP